MKVSSPMKIQDLRKKFAAFQAAEAAVSSVTTAHIAMRSAGMGGCEPVMNAAREAMKTAQGQFRTAYQTEEAELDDDGADLLHKAIFGQ